MPRPSSDLRLSPLATPSATREVLERHGLYTKYALGQNFLVNDGIVRKIVELAGVAPHDHVLEVGPGIGTLTAALLQRAARVTAVEMDHDLPAVLADTLAEWSDRFTLLPMDALDVQEPDLQWPSERLGNSPATSCVGALVERPLEGVDGEGEPPLGEQAMNGIRINQPAPGAEDSVPMFPNKLVSNLPYAVAATVVLDYLQRFPFLESATVMVQKEVADRMMARPGTKAYGAYTVKLSLYAQTAGRFPVGPGNFFPPPRVESAVIRLDRKPSHAADGRPLTPEELAATCKMIDAAFATRRKTIANSCKTHFANDSDMQAALPHLFERADIDPRRRGETLTKQEFIALGLALLSA